MEECDYYTKGHEMVTALKYYRCNSCETNCTAEIYTGVYDILPGGIVLVYVQAVCPTCGGVLDTAYCEVKMAVGSVRIEL